MIQAVFYSQTVEMIINPWTTEERSGIFDIFLQSASPLFSFRVHVEMKIESYDGTDNLRA